MTDNYPFGVTASDIPGWDSPDCPDDKEYCVDNPQCNNECEEVLKMRKEV